MTRSECLDELASLIVEIPVEHPRVAIDGVDGAGKTLLADELRPLIEARGHSVIRASADGFHHPRARRYRRGPFSPEGYFEDSFDYTKMRSTLLDPLADGGGFRTAVFDFRNDEPIRGPLRTAKPGEILLFDGIFLMRPELDGCWNLTVWVEAPFELATERALMRDASADAVGAALRDRYERRYVPGQRLYLERCRPTERADIVFGNIDVASPQVEYRRRERPV